ncbi:MAG: hypothetical protein D6718_01990, partial [Acidobacteria bacterium]
MRSVRVRVGRPADGPALSAEGKHPRAAPLGPSAPAGRSEGDAFRGSLPVSLRRFAFRPTGLSRRLRGGSGPDPRWVFGMAGLRFASGPSGRSGRGGLCPTGPRQRRASPRLAGGRLRAPLRVERRPNPLLFNGTGGLRLRARSAGGSGSSGPVPSGTRKDGGAPCLAGGRRLRAPLRAGGHPDS